VRITRLYHPRDLTPGTTTLLDKNTSSHLTRVLRTKTGTTVTLFNGDGYDYVCKTLNNHPKNTLLAVESRIKINNESNLFISLIQGISRLDRMETSIQKAVELGVNKIIPVLCQHSNSKLTENKQLKKIAHWRNITISACEQSGRCVLPELSNIIQIKQIDSLLNPDALKIILNPQARESLKQIKPDQNKEGNTVIEIFIGPEGGLAKDELAHLQTLKFQNIGFGPRTLRTETAGPAVISALQILWGDF